ncbi:MAG TPA: HAMP domain-containing sensor histidine kinase [Caulobacteraceae bacterium]|jgi:signal transduction histidine kinase|nr:HAMP domain-containing sensor histidine kinase [Caulobacteraceae bacterium]
MGLPQLFRTTPFRLTLLFLALFAASAAAFLAYIYLTTAGEVTRLADRGVIMETRGLEAIYQAGGDAALLRRFAESVANDRPFLYLLTDSAGHRLGGSLAAAPVSDGAGPGPVWMHFMRSSRNPPDDAGPRRWAIGETTRLSGGETLIVATDVTYAETFVLRIVRAMWGAGALVVLLGLAGGLLVSRNVNRSVARLNTVVAAVRGGDLGARAPLGGSRDEFDELGAGLNDMLDRLERSITSIRHAGDAIAHDLRSPLTRLRARLELALLDVEAGRGDPKAALAQALGDADALLATFATVLAIARLEAAGATPKQASFDPSQLAADIAELYEPACEEHGLDFKAELGSGLSVRGDRDFLAQALANLLDNAVKYTPRGGAIMLRSRRRSSGEIEFSITDTGPGVCDQDRGRIVQRFVRLENSRNQPGAGLGLSLVAAVAKAHGGRLELDEGPGKVGEFGPGLRVALVLPRAA